MSNHSVLKVHCFFILYQYGVMFSFKIDIMLLFTQFWEKRHTLVRSFYKVVCTIGVYVVLLVFNMINLNSVVSNQSKLFLKGQPGKWSPCLNATQNRLHEMLIFVLCYYICHKPCINNSYAKNEIGRCVFVFGKKHLFLKQFLFHRPYQELQCNLVR